MTAPTVIVARDYGTAATVAAQRGLGLDWVYPATPEHVLGLGITELIYVEGWEQSTVLTAETLSIISSRMTSGAVEHHLDATLHAQDPLAPFLEAVTPTSNPRNIQHGLARRRPLSPWWLVPIAGVLGFAGAALIDALGILQ